MRKKSLLSPWAFNRTAAWMFKAKSLFSAKFSAARTGPWLVALDYGLVSVQIWKPFVWLKAPWSRESFVVSHFRSLHGWYVLHSHRQSLRAWIELHVGSVRWDGSYGVRNLTSHNFVLRVRAEGESKWSFSSQLWVQSKSVLFFILPASGKPDARLRRRRYDVEAKLELSRPQTHGPLSSSLRTSKQIHADSSSTAHSGHRSRPELGCSCFPKPHVFLSDPSKRRAVVRRSCATGDMATGRPRAKKYRDPCRKAFGHFAQCTSTCRSTQVKIATTDLWPEEMFTGLGLQSD